MKLAIVIPWFGRELKGGAEQQAWQVAARLAQRKHTVEVLTTCSRSHQDGWATNHHPEGVSTEPEGFAIRRFAVEPRDRSRFNQACGRIQSCTPEELKIGLSPVSSADAQTFTDELIRSGKLLGYLEERKQFYDWFIFLPYLYGPVIHGVRIVGERAALQPCLHDEPYAYLPQVATAFQQAGRLLFNSEGEQELALRLFGPALWSKSFLVGEGVEAPLEIPGTPSHDAAERERFVLYLGRREVGKNVPLLLAAFARFRQARPNSRLQLVLAGHGTVDTKQIEGVRDLGLVAAEKKQELLRECLALFQPSVNESFSRVLMEAWLHGKPVAAHASCLATALSVQSSDGGWLAATETEWAQLFADVDRFTNAELNRLGQNGRDYALKLADWDKVMERYETALAPTPADTMPKHFARNGASRGAINQLLPNLSYGDAISNHALWIRNQLRTLGFTSEIYARFLDPRIADEGQTFSPGVLNDSSALIYHHSIGSELTAHAAGFDGPKYLIYHNITPGEFYQPFAPDHADVLRRGRLDLQALASDFPLACGVSAYNTKELVSLGFKNAETLPIPVEPAKWALPPDADLLRRLQDGRPNVLFVGRIAPNKRQDELIVAFRALLKLIPAARLILVGKAEEDDPYAGHLSDLVTRYRLADDVILAGSVHDAELAAYYRTAHLFWSMSEHEGFCVPLIEAMWFGIPVLAFRTSAVPETVGAGALLFTDKSNLKEIAALAAIIIRDKPLRAALLRAQRKARVRFLPENVAPLLHSVIQRLTSNGKSKLAAPRSSAVALLSSH